MIPYSYSMLNMEGIDLAEANGTVVPGIYSRIVEAVNSCGDVVFYNWKFAGIEIAPQHTSILLGNPIVINGSIQVTELDEVIVPGINPEPPSAVLIPLSVTENGLYNPDDYYADGFSSVNVEVPEPPSVVLIPLSVTENGLYDPDDYDVDGFSSVNVEVPTGGGRVEAYHVVTVSTSGANASVSVQKGTYDFESSTPFTPTGESEVYLFQGSVYTENNIDDMVSLDSYVNNSYNWGIKGISGHTIYVLNEGVFAPGVRAKTWYYNITVDFYILLALI